MFSSAQYISSSNTKYLNSAEAMRVQLVTRRHSFNVVLENASRCVHGATDSVIAVTAAMSSTAVRCLVVILIFTAFVLFHVTIFLRVFRSFPYETGVKKC